VIGERQTKKATPVPNLLGENKPLDRQVLRNPNPSTNHHTDDCQKGMQLKVETMESFKSRKNCRNGTVENYDRAVWAEAKQR
jgi:hypothetical protein